MATTVTNAKDFRKKRKPYTFVASDELTVLLKRVDMVGLLVTGAIPMPLMHAADKFEKIREQITDDTKPEDAIKMMEDAGDEGEFRKFLETYAAYVVLEPKIFVLKDGLTVDHCPEDAILAQDINLLELLAIWNAVPTDDEPAPEVPAPATFRSGESEPAGAPAPVGEVVRETPVVVDGPKGEFIHG